MKGKKATTSVPIEELLAMRWSPRAFDPDRAVNKATLRQLLEAARWAPSCFNDQPWRYLIFDRFGNRERWDLALDCLVEGNRSWAAKAPLLIAAISNTVFSHHGKPNRWCHYDTGAASENLCLQATAMGLAAHQMGGFDAEKVAATFGLPETCEPIAMIAIGYVGDPQNLDERMRNLELGERSRRPVSEFAHIDAWGTAFTDTE